MSDDREQLERHPTDEPDGTPAYAASLRRPGESTGPGDDEPETTDEPGTAGDSSMYRPD